MILGARDYREVLRSALLERQGSNPAYSLRAFARDVGLTAAQLSLVLSGKRGLSKSSGQKICHALGMSPDESGYFEILIESSHARRISDRKRARAKLSSFESYRSDAYRLQLNLFKVISDWHHFALLQLLGIRGQSHASVDLASELGISNSVVIEALDRLTQLELIEKHGKRYKVLRDTVATTDGVPSEAIRKFHRQILEKALQAIPNQSVDERYLMTTILPVSQSDMARAQARIQEFHQKFVEEFGSAPDQDRIYGLAVQYFRISKGKRSNSK